MNQSGQTNTRWALALFTATLLLFLPTWVWLVEAWWSDPYYSHAVLIVPVSLYLAWVQRKAFSENPPMPNNLGFILVAIALGIHLWSMVWRAYYISALIIPLALAGLGTALFGGRITRRFWFPLAFMIFMVPLPIAERVGPVLEGWGATSATSVAQFLGVAARNEGSQVFLPNSTFTVGIPCGGLRSIIAIITLVTLWAYIAQGRVIARLFVWLTSIPIAIAANTLRITLLFVIAYYWGADTGLDYFHDWSSPVLFLLSFMLLLVIAKIVKSSNVRWEVVIPS